MTDSEALALITSIADYTARTRRGGCLERDELISIGWIAHRRALETWQEGMGASLKTYVSKGIRKAIVFAVRGEMPRGYRQSPDARPVMCEADNERLPDEGMSPEDAVFARELDDIMFAALDIRSYMIVFWRTSGGYTLQEIGDMLGITKERVRQIYNQSLAVLRDQFTKLT